MMMLFQASSRAATKSIWRCSAAWSRKAIASSRSLATMRCKSSSTTTTTTTTASMINGGTKSIRGSLSLLATSTNNDPESGARSFSSSSDDNDDRQDYYYDSQSGQHVPVHNENQVSVFLAQNHKDLKGVYGDDDPMIQWNEYGIQGIYLEDEDSTEQLSSVVANIPKDKKNFKVFVPFPMDSSLQNSSLLAPRMVPMLEYRDGQVDELKDALLHLVQSSTASSTSQSMLSDDNPDDPDPTQGSLPSFETALLLGPDVGDAMLTATAVAELIDTTVATNTAASELAGSVANYLVVTGERMSNGDDVLQLVEELSYLDVTGPTMKARIVVNLSRQANQEAQETLDDCLAMGINKYVIDEERLKWIGHYVREEAGKECKVWSM